jgi:hypothetical protein
MAEYKVLPPYGPFMFVRGIEASGDGQQSI